ncbi:rhomboid family intramembrane serine protease [Undibacterium sp. RuTC16W]|uniref:rhomboid family intramembrane serine protease n=1 Tax=Undibacterium sp. RuTC16W TaxID=3413048 RepID=UPI003BF4392A
MKTHSKFPLLSLTLVLISLFAWFVVASRLGLHAFQSQRSSLLLQVGAVDGVTFESGQVWRLLTSQFLHVHFLHMLVNLASIYLLASAVERISGRTALAVIYLGGGTTGQYFGVLLHPGLVGSGASQALMALCGFTLLAYRHFSSLRYVVYLSAAIVMFQISLDVYVSGTFKPGHSFGLLAGMAFATLFNRITPASRGDA